MAESISEIRWDDRVTMKNIFDRFYFSLCSFACRYVRDNDIVEDFVQEAFLKLWERKTEMKQLFEVKGFLYVSVRNLCLDHLKHQKVKARNQETLVRELESSEEVSGYILEKEVDGLIYEALRELPERSRQVVVMTMRGSSNDKIAEDLLVSVNTVKTLKLRAYQVLRKKLIGIQWTFFLQILVHLN